MEYHSLSAGSTVSEEITLESNESNDYVCLKCDTEITVSTVAELIDHVAETSMNALTEEEP